MPRHTRLVTITEEGRDKGKSFLIREMDADSAEWWAARALIVMGNAGVTLPAGTVEAGLAGMAYLERAKGVASALFLMGLRMLPGVDARALRPLMEEMMTCVQYQPPGNFPAQALYDGDMSQIEEIATRLQLRVEVLELHLGFSLAGALSTLDTPPPAPAT